MFQPAKSDEIFLKVGTPTVLTKYSIKTYIEYKFILNISFNSKTKNFRGLFRVGQGIFANT